MFTETGYHSQKFRPRRHYLEEILPHRRHLIMIASYQPGEKAEGLAEFKADPNHHPDRPILLASEIIQALLEISEFAIRSKNSLQAYKFLAFDIKIKIRETVPIQDSLRLPVFAKRIGNTTDASDTPSSTLGMIQAAIKTDGQKKYLVEIIIKYKLLQ